MSNLKKLLALTLALILAMSIFAACGTKTDSNPSDPGTSSGSDVTGSDPNRALNIAVSGDTGTLYPFAASGGFVSLMYAFYEPLWDFKTDGTKVNILAADWQKVSDTEYKLTIRDDVKFANGNPLTAEDVMFSMQLCKDDPRFYLNVKVIDFDRTKVTGDYTMDIFYTTYDCTQEISFSQLMILDKESYDLESLSTKPVGTGPYIATDYIVNSHVTCQARDDYWGEPAKIKNINFKVINEQAQIVNALEVGDIDITSSIPVDEAEYVKSLGFVVDSSFGGYANTALYSMAGALASKEARWAVSYAMDRESMAQIMYKGLSSVPSYPTSEHAQDYEARFADMHDTYATGYNVEKAKQYAEQSGLVGKTLKIITNGTEVFNDVAVAIQENLRAIGVESTIASYDSATYFSIIMDESNFDIALFYLSSPSMMAADVMANYVDFIPLGWKGAEREKYGELSKQAVHTYDPTERGNLLYEALKIFVDVDPWFAICEAVAPRAQSGDVDGVEYFIAGNLYYHVISFK